MDWRARFARARNDGFNLCIRHREGHPEMGQMLREYIRRNTPSAILPYELD
jgi:hypothetical protein